MTTGLKIIDVDAHLREGAEHQHLKLYSIPIA